MNTPPSSLNPHPSSWKWWVCGALLLATFLNYMDRQALAVTLPELKQTYHLHEARNGWLEGCFGVAFAAGSLMFGVLADRFGPRRLYPVVLVGWSAAGIATGFAAAPAVVELMEQPWVDALARAAHLTWLLEPGGEPGTGTYRWLLLCRTTLGLFEAGHWPCALITAQRLLAAKDRPLGNGILQSGASVASILIPVYAEVVESLGGGWPTVFWSVGVGGLLWVPLWLILVGRHDLDAPPAVPTVDAEHGIKTAWPPDPWGIVRLVVLGVIVSCLAVSWQFLRAWLPLFLQDFHGYKRLDTRLATAGYFVAAEVGCLLVGVVVKLLVALGCGVHAARTWAFAGFAALSATAAAVPFLGSGPLMLAGLMAAGAGILGLHPLYYALSQELPTRRMGLLSGGLAAVAWVVTAVNQVLLGAEIKATKSYDVGLVIAGLAPLVALLALVVLWKPGRDGK